MTRTKVTVYKGKSLTSYHQLVTPSSGVTQVKQSTRKTTKGVVTVSAHTRYNKMLAKTAMQRAHKIQATRARAMKGQY